MLKIKNLRGMAMIKKFIILFVIFLLFSCTEDNNPINTKTSNTREIIDTLQIPEISPKPLKIGNTWIYKVQYYDASGNIIFNGFDTVRLEKIIYWELLYENVTNYKSLIPVFTEKHSIKPLTPVYIYCIKDFWGSSKKNYFDFNYFIGNVDLFEDYQPFTCFSYDFSNSGNRITTCKTCGNGMRKFIKSNKDTASFILENDIAKEVELSWDKYLKLQGYYLNHRLIVIDTVARELPSFDKLNCKVNKYLCEQYYARNIGLIKYKYYKINENYQPILLVTSDLIEFYEAND